MTWHKKYLGNFVGVGHSSTDNALKAADNNTKNRNANYEQVGVVQTVLKHTETALPNLLTLNRLWVQS